MNLRAFYLILGVFLGILRICHVEDPQVAPGVKLLSEASTASLDIAEANKGNFNVDSTDSSDTSSITYSTTPLASASSLTSSSSSLKYETLNVDSSSSFASSVSSSSMSSSVLSSLSSEQSISSSELEQLVVPTIAPATPRFDTDSVTTSSSEAAASSVSSSSPVTPNSTESSNQEKNKEDEKKQNFVLISNPNQVKTEEEKNENKQEKQEMISVDKQPEVEHAEKLDEEKSKNVPEPTPEASAEKTDPPDTPTPTPIVDAPNDKEEDSITAGLKQAEEEIKPTSEEMPSFDEFKRQLLQEEEKQKSMLKKQKDIEAGPGIPPKPKSRKVKQRKQNNYASLDCGAKLLKANPEASNIFSILQDNRDIYMLNPCSAKIWFILELCDTVQVKSIDIANFELFSSTPESFRVYVSGRYPTRDWTLLGTFQARDERIVQSFPLEEPIYAKYFKVEMLTHFGKEHYCPLSLFRVFGTSMMEELEDHEAGGQDEGDSVDHDDDLVQVLPPDPSAKADDQPTKQNILTTVGDTLMNIVKVAAKKLTGVIKDSDANVSGEPDSLVTSTVQSAKTSIVTLIPSEDDDDNFSPPQHSNITANVSENTSTNASNVGKPQRDDTTFYDKIDSDKDKSSSSTSGFTSCELLVRMLGHAGFGCFMGKVLYSKQKYQNFTPRNEAPKTGQKSKEKARDKVLAPASEGKQVKADKEKGDSKKEEEKKEEEKEEKKVEEKEKKSTNKIDHDDETKIIQDREKMKGDLPSVIDKGENESTEETKNTPDERIESVQDKVTTTSSTSPVDLSSIIQPSEIGPSIVQSCDPKSEDKGTPTLSSISSITTQPPRNSTGSTQPLSSDAAVDQSEKKNSSSTGLRISLETDKVQQNKTTNTTDMQDTVSRESSSRKDTEDPQVKLTESSTQTDVPVINTVATTVEESLYESKTTCTSMVPGDKSVEIPVQPVSPSACIAPTVTSDPKDVDVLEFKILDSMGREGTAHAKKPGEPVKPDQPVEPDQQDQPVEPDQPVKPDKPVEADKPVEPDQPDKPVKPDEAQKQDEKEQTKDSKEESVVESSDSKSQSDQNIPKKNDPTKTDDSVVSVNTLDKQSKSDDLPSASETQSPAQPTQPPPHGGIDSPESINPLPPPPVVTDNTKDAASIIDSTKDAASIIEASLVDDVGKASSSAAGQGLGSSGAQKESIFMRLTNRIKALEQNLTLSTLYMEKLNQKYRKIMDEMQKNFDKKVNLFTNATRKAEAVIKTQKEQISNLQSNADDTRHRMDQINKKLENLNVEVMERHIIGLFLEVILIIVLFIVFRRWDRARIMRDIFRESLTNGRTYTIPRDHPNYPVERTYSNILNGHLTAREQLQRSFDKPSEPENIGTLSQSVTLRHKEEFFAPLDGKKKRNKKRPKSAVLTTETSPTNTEQQGNQSSLVSVTAGLLFSPARGLLHGLSDSLRFKRSNSLDDAQINRPLSTSSSNRKLHRTKSLDVIHENTEDFFPPNTTKKGRISTLPLPCSQNNLSSSNGIFQRPATLVVTQRKGKALEWK